MMTFGWRPSDSCFVNSAQKLAKQTQQASSCPSATWFYLLMGLAVFMGAAKK